MSDEFCITTDTVTRHEVKKTLSYRRLKIQKHMVNIGLSCSGFSFYGHFNKQFNYGVFVTFKTVR